MIVALLTYSIVMIGDATKDRMKTIDIAKHTATRTGRSGDQEQYKQLRNGKLENTFDTGKLWQNFLGWVNQTSASSPTDYHTFTRYSWRSTVTRTTILDGPETAKDKNESGSISQPSVQMELMKQRDKAADDCLCCTGVDNCLFLGSNKYRQKVKVIRSKDEECSESYSVDEVFQDERDVTNVDHVVCMVIVKNYGGVCL